MRTPTCGGTLPAALGWVGVEARVAVPGLIEVLKDKEDQVLREAAIALALTDTKAGLRVLLETMQSSDAHRRTHAAHALGMKGKKASAAIPLLIEALKDRNPQVRSHAARALGCIGAEEEAVVPALIDTLKDKDAIVRAEAAEALLSLGGKARAAVPALIGTLKDRDARVRSSSVHALGVIGVEAKAAVPALRTALKDEDAYVRLVVLWALPMIDVQVAVPALIDALKDTDDSVRRQAAQVLRALGEKAGETEKEPWQFLKAPATEVQRAIPHLIVALRDHSSEVRCYAARALGSIGLNTDVVETALVEAMKDSNEEVQRAACSARVRINPKLANQGYLP